MIIHIPHSSRKIDGHINLQDEELNHDYLTDDYVLELFEYDDHRRIIFPYSRFVCDVERLLNDPMEEKGQGVIYRYDYFSNPIERITPDSEIMNMYNAHHKELNITVNFALSLFEKVAIVDAHTFTPIPRGDPDICIGTDSFHTPTELIDRLEEHFEFVNGYSVGIDYPYSGTIIPSHLYHKEENLISIMLEVNKDSHCADKKKMRKVIKEALEIIDEFEQDTMED